MSAVSSSTEPTFPSQLIPITHPDRIYRILGIAGTGRDGTVYEALTPDGDPVAIKINKTATRAMEELMMLRATKNVPNMPHFRLSFLTDLYGHNIMAIVTDWLPCKDSYEMFCKEGTPHISNTQITATGTQILKALEGLHSIGIYHGDVKVENMALDPKTDKAYLFDLGTAKKIEEMHIDGTLMHYSPECVFSESYKKRIDESRDLWALGSSLIGLYTKTNFFFIPENRYCNWENDYLYQMVLNFEMPSSDFIESLSQRDKRFFQKSEDGSYSLSMPISKRVEEQIGYFIKYKDLLTRKYGAPLWKARIYMAADRKGETKASAVKVIQLIEPMLGYKKRLDDLTRADDGQREKITATNCLQIARGLQATEEEEAPAAKKIRANEGKVG